MDDDTRSMFERMLARFDAVDDRFDAVDARFNGVDAKLEQHDALFGAMMAKFERIDDHLTGMRDDLQVTTAAAMRSIERSDADREDVRTLTKVVHGMQIVLQRLQTRVDDLERKAS